MPTRRLWGASVLVIATMLLAGAPVQAGDETGHVLPVALVATVESALGSDTVVLTGWVRIMSSEPRIESGRSVLDLTMTEADLVGGSRLGAVFGTERPDQDGHYISNGEVRATQSGGQFPASSHIDLFITARAPNSSLGPLTLHNEEPFGLEVAGAISQWPAYGASYRFSGPSCVPLLSEDNSVHVAGFCVSGLTLDIAPLLPSFSVARDGPRGLHPADVLSLAPQEAVAGAGQMPFVAVPCSSLGLSDAGCDPGSDGTQDDIDALSFGRDFVGSALHLYLSVGPGATGLPGTGVRGQTACEGLAPEPEPDVFSTMLNGSNALLLDGNGPVGRCTPAFPLGLVEGFSVRDNLDGLDALPPSTLGGTSGGAPVEPVYFSLDALSPSLAEMGFGPGDVLRSAGGAVQRYASAGDLGLVDGDDVDALCVGESGDGAFGSEDAIYVSLAAGSPSLATLGADPGDVLATAPLRVVAPASIAGLAAGDDVDALSCEAIAESVLGDVTCDFVVNSIDALLVMQYNGHLIDTLPCPGGADVDGSGGVDSVDAALILQLHAGLVTRLPLHEAEEARR